MRGIKGLDLNTDSLSVSLQNRMRVHMYTCV